MKHTQQHLALYMIAFLIGGGLLYTVDQLIYPQDSPTYIYTIMASLVVLTLLWLLCWYQWERGRNFVIVTVMFIVILNHDEPYITSQISLDIFIPVVVALLLGNIWWVIGTSVLTYALLLVQATGHGVYAQLDTVTVYAIVVGGLLLAWSITDAAQKTAEARAEEAKQHAQAVTDINVQLLRRDAIMEAVGFAAQQFLAEAAWTQQVMPVLTHLATAARVNSVAIFKNQLDTHGALQASRQYISVLEGTTATLDVQPDQLFSYDAAGLRRWRTLLEQGQSIYGQQSRFPPAEAHLLAAQGVYSTAIIPIFVQHSWWGFMRCDSYVAERIWITAEVDALKAAADILGAAIHRDHAEMALRKSEATNRALLNALPDLMFRIARNGVVLDVKVNKDDDLAIVPSTFIGRHVSNILPVDAAQTVLHYNKQTLKTDSIQVFEYDLEISNVQRSFETRMVVSGKDEVLAVVRDITERKKVDRLKSEFISVVSHELRTPLTSIRGALGLVINGVAGEVAPQAHAMLEIATKNSERLVRLINDMLDMEKMESGKMTFHLRPLPLVPLVEQAIETLQTYVSQFDVSVVFTHHVADLMVYGDSDRLIQVFTNLLSNAAKFSPPRSIIRVAAMRHGTAARITVSDSGPGIAEEFRASIFDRFTQADASDARQKAGTGLGLNIAKSIIDTHGGQITFTTEVGVGTTFIVDLTEWHAESSSLDPTEPVADRFERPRILICEDDHDVATLLNIMLSQAGFSADIAYSAAQVHARLAENSYDGMTLDLMLPDQDGLALICELRQQPATHYLPIVVVSARADEERKSLNGDALEIVDWINKPIEQEQLIAAVARATHMHIDTKPRILHVEDDQDVVAVVSHILHEVADIIWAASVREARARLTQETFDLVLLDLTLPDGSGLAIIPLLNQQAFPIPVVIFSAQEPQRTMSSLIAATLVKSRTSNQTLLQTITKLLSRYHPVTTLFPTST